MLVRSTSQKNFAPWLLNKAIDFGREISGCSCWLIQIWNHGGAWNRYPRSPAARPICGLSPARNSKDRRWL